MRSHDELELLSSYLDGELDAAERARLDAHLATCVDCRAVLAGLRATVADLTALPQPAPTPHDSWALRAAIRKARSPMRRWQRVSWAAGAVAAAAITFVVMTVPGDDGKRELALSEGAGGGSSSVPIYQTGKNLSAAQAQARLLDVANIVPGAQAQPAQGPDGAAAEDDAVTVAKPLEEDARSLYAFSTGTDPTLEAIDRCVDIVRSSTQEFLEPIQYELATFEGKPAFLLFFHTQDRYELWVVGRSDCTVLYFAQA